jgi:hypothetical protein
MDKRIWFSSSEFYAKYGLDNTKVADIVIKSSKSLILCPTGHGRYTKKQEVLGGELN